MFKRFLSFLSAFKLQQSLCSQVSKLLFSHFAFIIVCIITGRLINNQEKITITLEDKAALSIFHF